MNGVFDKTKGVKGASLICFYNNTDQNNTDQNLTIEWSKNGQPLQSNSNYTITNPKHGVSNLTIKTVGMFCFAASLLTFHNLLTELRN